jgi:anaerobic magnesium-protoporphyrin IX monomethyl ester cyclase
MNLKVFLGNAPWYKKGFYGVRAGSRWPHFEAVTNCYMPFPFQLAYAASILEASGIEVLLVDGIAEKITEEQFIRRILQFKPNFVFLEVSTPSFNYDIQFTEKLREVVGRNVNIALGGPHAPMFECQFLDRYPFVDFALVGEYELTLKLLAHNLKQEVELCTVPGILYRNQKGKAVSNGQP